jgi:hypothetical protein
VGGAVEVRSLATPCRTVITKDGPRNTLISPNSISSAVSW